MVTVYVFGSMGVIRGWKKVNCVVLGMELKLVRVRVVVEVEVLTRAVHLGEWEASAVTAEMTLVVLVKRFHTPVNLKTIKSPGPRSVSGLISNM